MHTGPLSPSSITNSVTAGEANWANPGNAVGSDNAKATALLSGMQQQTGKLQAWNPNPTDIADSDTVAQVAVNVEKSAGSLAGSPVDLRASLYVGGVLQADNQAAAGVWPTSDTVNTYVFAVNLTGAQVKASDFGFMLSAKASGSRFTNGVNVDNITFEFDY